MPDSAHASFELLQRRVEGGRRIVAAQEALVAKIKAEGGDTAVAQDMLESFRRTLKSFEDDRRRLLSDQQQSLSPAR
jgi:hypothetical protein